MIKKDEEQGLDDDTDDVDVEFPKFLAKLFDAIEEGGDDGSEIKDFPKFEFEEKLRFSEKLFTINSISRLACVML